VRLAEAISEGPTGRAAAGVGHNYLARDPGSDFARRMLPFADVSGVAVPSLGLAAALLRPRVMPVHRRSRRPSR
jgi:hypothetical protein